MSPLLNALSSPSPLGFSFASPKVTHLAAGQLGTEGNGGAPACLPPNTQTHAATEAPGWGRDCWSTLQMTEPRPGLGTS